MFGNMGIWWIDHFGKWETKHDTMIYIYQENTKTDTRRYRRISDGYQPVNTRWLDGGEWQASHPPPPSPMIRRAGRS